LSAGLLFFSKKRKLHTVMPRIPCMRGRIIKYAIDRYFLLEMIASTTLDEPNVSCLLIRSKLDECGNKRDDELRVMGKEKQSAVAFMPP
jgi:hypothetical protein